MTQRVTVLSVLIAVAGMLLCAGTAEAALISWLNPVSGAWSDTTKWSPPIVPGPADIAFINVEGTYTVTMDVDATIQRMSVGTSVGTQTLEIDGFQLDVTVGVPSTIVSGGKLRIINGGALIGTNGAPLNNLAAIELDGGTIDLPSFSQNSTIDVLGGTNSIDGAYSPGSSSILTISGGSITFANAISNPNVINLSGDGATLNLTTGSLTNAGTITVSGAGGARVIGAELINQSTLVIQADLELDKADAAHDNSGTISLVSGDITVTQTGTSPSFTNNSAITVAGGNVMTVDGGTLENGLTGAIDGEGTLDVSTSVFTNNGDLIPGTSPGIMVITGGYTQGSTGTLNIEIGGFTPGTEHDQLQISGAATFDGELNVSILGPFFPVDGDTFEIITYGSHTGAFTDTTSLSIGGGIILLQEYGVNSLVLRAFQPPDVVQPIEPEVCITPADPTLTIPFEFVRVNQLDVRAYRVTFSISPELELVNGTSSIVEGPFLSGYCGGGCTAFQVNDHLDGSYTVDATILGTNCGPDSSGTLFTIEVTDANGDGIGTIAVDDAIVRGCDNQQRPGEPGTPISIGIDSEAPPTITDLAATQVKSGNDSDGTTGITVSFTGDTGVDLVEVFRKGYGDYPEYDDGTGSAPTAPATPGDAIAEGWTLTAVTATGQVDEPATRDYYYYITFVTSACNLQSASNMTGGTLNYHLGDVSDGITPCDGDNLVGTVDLSFFGDNYFKTGVDVDPVNCLDIGPTDDFSIDGLPTTDNEIGFEDLVLFGINFNAVGKNLPTEPGLIADLSTEDPSLVLNVDAAAPGTSILTARLSLEGNVSAVKGIHGIVSYDKSRMELVDVTEGDLLGNQGNVFFKQIDREGGIVLDAVVIGQKMTFAGSGDVAVLRFRTQATAFPPMLAVSELRDLQNRSMLDPDYQPEQPDAWELPQQQIKTPAATQLLGARPNPFMGRTDIYFRLSNAENVSLRIFDINGRLVRSIEGTMSAGEHRLAWDGKSDRGQSLPSGIYMYNFQAGSIEKTQKLYLFR